MKLEQLDIILRVLKGPSSNYYINSPSLSRLGQIIFYPKQKEVKLQERAISLLRDHWKENYETEMEKLKTFHFSSYFTPKETIQEQIALLKRHNFSPNTILDPSAGTGAYVQELKKVFPKAKITALEPEGLSYEILKFNNKENKNVTTVNSTFEDLFLSNRQSPGTRFDLVMTNVPFGSFQIEDAYKHSYIKDKASQNINAYFNRYAPELLAENGISLLLTSKNFLDQPTYNATRNEISQRFNFIGAYRLHNSTFANEGTSVVTDLIMLQRSSSPSRPIPDTTSITIEDSKFNINQHFIDNPNLVQGELVSSIFHQRPDLSVKDTGITLKELLKGSLDIVPLPSPKTTITNSDSTEDQKEDLSEKIEETVPPTHRRTHTEGLLRDDHNTYKIYQGQPHFFIDGHPHQQARGNKGHLAILNEYIVLKDQWISFKNALISDRDHPSLPSRYQELQYEVNMYEFRNGSIDLSNYLANDQYQESIRKEASIISDVSFQEYIGRSTPSRKLIPETTVQEVLDLTPEKLYQTVRDHYNDTGMYLEILKKTFQSNANEILKLGIDHEIIAYDPTYDNNGDFIQYELQPFFVVTSGDLLRKIETLSKKPIEGIDTQQLISKLKDNLNGTVPIKEIDFNMVSPFVPIELKKQFLKRVLDENIELIHIKNTSENKVSFVKIHNHLAHQEFSVKTKGRNFSYKQLLNAFANDESVLITYSVQQGDQKVKRIDRKATIIVEQKIKDLNNRFKQFIESNAKYSEIVEKNYFKNFLAHAPLRIDPNFLKVPKGMVHEPYPHQRNGALYGLFNGNALFDHVVGHGKSLTIGLLSYKLLKTKKANRVLILTLKSVASSLTHEIRDNFPELSVFQLTQNNFSAKNLRSTLDRIEHTQPQVIVGEHTHLQKIPKDRELIERIFTEKLDMIAADLKEAKKHGVRETKAIVKGLVIRQQNLLNGLKELNRSLERNEELPTMGILGIDALMVDESHYFKNIGYTTRHNRVKGLNDGSDKKKTLDLEFSIRSITERLKQERNIFFFSGTPLKNSAIEMYAIQRYLTPQLLKDRSIYNFDSWASLFLRKSQEIEPDTFGSFKEYLRFRHYVNLTELSIMYNNIAHISDQKTFRTHEIDRSEEFVKLEPSDQLKELQERTRNFAVDHAQKQLFGHDKYGSSALRSSFITALGINREALVDPFLISERKNIPMEFSQEDAIKTHRIAKDAFSFYQMSAEHKGTILIFSNIGTPNKDNEYNSYQTLKNILVNSYGIPTEEIAFAQQHNTPKSKKEFQAKINDGKIRIAFGSTQTLGTGTNIQQRGVAILHWDIPYSPDEFEQREGRFLRKGNKIANHYDNKVQVRYYGYEGTTDIFSYSLNRHKSRFIDQIKFNKGSRNFDNNLEEMNNMSHGEKEAALVGNMDLFKLRKAETQYERMKYQYDIFLRSKSAADGNINFLRKEQHELVRSIRSYQNLLHSLPFEMPERTSPSKELDEFIMKAYKALKIAAPDESMKTLTARMLSKYIGQPDRPLASFKLKGSHYFLKVVPEYSQILDRTKYTPTLSGPNIRARAQSIPEITESNMPWLLFRTIRSAIKKHRGLQDDLGHNQKSIKLNERLKETPYDPEKLKLLKEHKKEIQGLKKSIKMKMRQWT